MRLWEFGGEGSKRTLHNAIVKHRQRIAEQLMLKGYSAAEIPEIMSEIHTKNLAKGKKDPRPWINPKTGSEWEYQIIANDLITIRRRHRRSINNPENHKAFVVANLYQQLKEIAQAHTGDDPHTITLKEKLELQRKVIDDIRKNFGFGNERSGIQEADIIKALDDFWYKLSTIIDMKKQSQMADTIMNILMSAFTGSIKELNSAEKVDVEILGDDDDHQNGELE